MQQQLATIVASLESAQTRLHRLVDQLPDARWKSRPGPDQWSAAECIEHLNLTSRAYIPLLRHALEKGAKPATAPSRYRKDFLGGLFSALVGPLPRIAKKRWGRVKTTGEFIPQPVATRVETVTEFDRLQADLIAITRQADGFPLGDMKIVSPFGGKIRYNVYSALVILPRHQERHLGQAEDAATSNSLR